MIKKIISISSLIFLIFIFSPTVIEAGNGAAGSICGTNSDCQSNVCQPLRDGSKICTAPSAGNPPVANPAPVVPTQAKGDAGAICNGPADCLSNDCQLLPNGSGVCTAPAPGNPIVPNPGGNTGINPGGNPGGNTSGSGSDMLGGLKSILGTDNQGNGNSQIQKFPNLGSLVSAVLTIVFMIAGILMFIWAAAGIFQYMTAGGGKEGLAKAKARITWAVIGFIFVMVSFLLSSYVQELFKPKAIDFCTTQETIACTTGKQPKTCVMVNGQASCQ